MDEKTKPKPENETKVLAKVEPYHLGDFAKGGKIDFLTQGNVSIPLSIELLKGIVPIKKGDRAPSVTEMVMYVNTVIEQGCNCYLNECWLIMIRGKYVPIIAAQKRIAKAQSLPNYDGYEWGWIDKDGQRWPSGPENKVKQADIIGVWGRIYFKDRKLPFYHEIFRSEYKHERNDRPITMLLKTARDQVHKYAFANEMGNLCTENELYDERLPAPESDVKPRDERRMAVPSTTVDTTRAPADKTMEDIKAAAAKGHYTDSREKLTPESIKNIEAAADGDVVAVEYKGPEQELIDENNSEIKKRIAAAEAKEDNPESELVAFVCKECGLTYQYGKEEGKGVPCSCGKGLLVEVEKQPEPAEPAGDEDKKPEDAKTLYMEVNGMYVVQGGKDFFEFAAYVLLLDESEVSPSKLTDEQLKQIKAYIETSGVSIS